MYAGRKRTGRPYNCELGNDWLKFVFEIKLWEIVWMVVKNCLGCCWHVNRFRVSDLDVAVRNRSDLSCALFSYANFATVGQK